VRWPWGALKLENDCGTEVAIESMPDPLSTLEQLLEEHCDSVEFEVSMESFYESNVAKTSGPVFGPLMRNKFGAIVGGLIAPLDGKGMMLLLPQFKRKADLAVGLVSDVLTITHPFLFPDHEGSRWVHQKAYDHPSVLRLEDERTEIQRKADELKDEISSRIKSECDRLGFMHGLLTHSGDALTQDVIDALRCIGFQQVVDVDEHLGASVNKEEDIWITGRAPELLVEVKGLGRLPTEADCQQVTKYLNRRKSAWKTTEIQGVFLVNHQLGMPPLERENQGAFTLTQIGDARSDLVALMTTWHLFRLIRGMERWSWLPENVQDTFYSPGRSGLVPSHWKQVGVVSHFWAQAGAFRIEVVGSDSVGIGDTLGYAFSDRFEQEIITSLQISGKSVNEVLPGHVAGCKTNLPRSDLPNNTPVYKVRPANQ
jgi:hypothetical protein